MSTVVISKLSYASGEEVAKNIASRLGYDCIAEEVLGDASQRSQIPIEKINRALYDARSLFGMPLSTRKRYIAHVQAAICSRLLKDNVVFHGPFGHLLIKGVTHVLNVRVHAPMEDRVALKVKQEGCDPRGAERVISKDDKGRLTIAKEVFGVDDNDAGLFNLAIDTSKVDVDTAVGTIVETVRQDRYRPMTYSLQCMEDLELSSRVRASLVDVDPDVAVQAKKGAVRIRIRASGRAKEKRLEETRRIAENHDGVKEVEIEALTGLVDLIERRSR